MTAEIASASILQEAPESLGFLTGGGAMGALFRSFRWQDTVLGTPQDWPQSLRTAVSIILNSQYPMFVWWGEPLTNLYNDAYRPFLGEKHPRALGQSARNVWTEIWDLIGPRTEAVLERGESTFDEALLLIMDRFGYPEETYFTFSYSPIRDDESRVGGIFCAVTDETQRIIGQRRLKLLREAATACSECNRPDEVCAVTARCLSSEPRDLPYALIYLTGEDGRTAHLAGSSGIDAGWPGAPPIIDLQDFGQVWPLADAARKGEALVQDGVTARFRDVPKGPWMHAPDRAVIAPLAPSGQSAGAGFLVAGLNPFLPFTDEYSGFIRVLTDQLAAAIARAKNYQEERRRAETLAQLDAAKTTFFSNISHEFRTPLTLMLSPLEDLRARLAQEQDAPGLEFADIIRRNAARLLKLVNALLDFSRIEAGRMHARYRPTDIAALTADLASNFRSLTEHAGLNLTIDCPPLREPVFVDRDMWETIVLNLISNAFKFTFEGGIAVRVREAQGAAELVVEDTGAGIAENDIPRVFERFHRVESTKGRSYEGSGIGLALVSELVRLHGGRVTVTSKVGQGSSFAVRIPFGTSHLPQAQIERDADGIPAASRALAFVEEAQAWVADQPVSVTPPVEAANADIELQAQTGMRHRILVADDNLDMRRYISQLLAAEGYDVKTVNDGESALNSVLQEIPDLIVSDVMMPGLDGFELVQRLRSDPRTAKVPIVLLSARAGEEARIEGLESGADDYLVKPFSARALIARVASNIKLARLRDSYEQRIASDLQNMTLLRDVGVLCGREGCGFGECVERIIDAAIMIMRAEKANLQVVDAETGELKIGAQRGYGKHFLDFFARVGDGGTACAEALRTGQRVIVQDVTSDEIFAGQPSRDVLLDEGIGAVVSTPLMSSARKILGVLSVHFAAPHIPGDQELRFKDLLAIEAADYLERKRSEFVEQTLVREVQHRSSNLLAMVQAIAARTLGGSAPLPEARRAFEERLTALARVNRQLTRTNWAGLALKEIAQAELEPFSSRAAIDGTDVRLPPQMAQNFSLALHELTTNAAKYGALSTSGGRVAVSWTSTGKDRDRRLKLRWQETGGPKVSPPSRQGFGSSLLRATFPDIRIDYASDGLICEIGANIGSHGAV